MRDRKWIGAAVVGLILVSFVQAQSVRYVDDDAPPGGDGTSWTTAYRYLQDALAEAAASGGAITEIRVAAGTYKPDQGAGQTPGDRTATFQLINGLSSNDASVTDATQLLMDSTRTENSYHVVTGSGTESTARLEGFTIKAGTANGSAEVDTGGAGMLNIAGHPTLQDCIFEDCVALAEYAGGGGMKNDNGSHPTLTNCIFQRNAAYLRGGGIFSDHTSSPTLTACAFLDNCAGDMDTSSGYGYGGGISSYHGSTAVLTDCTFMRNWAKTQGGGLYCYDGSSYTMTRCLVSENKAGSAGGGVVCFVDCNATINQCVISRNWISGSWGYGGQGGGLLILGSNLTITETRVVGNSADKGGGIWTTNGSTMQMEDCIVDGNWAQSVGGGIHTDGGTISNSVVINNTSWYGEGGGIYSAYGSLEVANCTIRGNTSRHKAGGGLYCFNHSPTITNCTFSGNSAGAEGGSISGYGASPQVTNCIMWGDTQPVIFFTSGTPSITYCDVEGGWPGTGNIDADPGFAFAEDLRLMPGSPCIDAGSNDPPGGLPPTDAEGQARSQDGDGNGDPVADMGAHEWSPGNPTIALGPSDITFIRFTEGPPAESQTLAIRNSGEGTLDWKITGTCSWLEVNPREGHTGQAPDHVTLTVSPDLLPGDYTCELNVTDDQAINSPRTVTVSVHVGRTLHVPTEYPTIQAAIDAATEGDLVLIADGTYTGLGNRGLDFKGKPITVRSENGPENCVIDCENSGRGFYFHNGESETSAIIGLTIRNANSQYTPDSSYGGGIYCYESSPLIRDCVITRNTAEHSGGGIACRSASPFIINCTITQNTFISPFGLHGGGGVACDAADPIISGCRILENVGSDGGGVWLINGASPTIKDCVIGGNSAGTGGGVGGYGNPTIISCIIAGNVANEVGGGIAVGSSSQASILNCLLSQNSASARGGGLGVLGGTVTVTNCTFTDNFSKVGGAVQCYYDSHVVLANCILWNDTASYGSELSAWGSGSSSTILTVQNCDITGGRDAVHGDPSLFIWGEGNIDADPRFVDPDGPDDYLYSWQDNNYQLEDDSPCIDAGANSEVPTDTADLDNDLDVAEPTPLDLNRLSRFRDDPDVPDTGAGTPPIVDIGAYEFYLDCNINGVWDPQDILDGTSADQNANGIPDECDPDCNHNGVLDDLDIASGASEDLNRNGVPDECESELRYITNLRTNEVYYTIQAAIDAAEAADELVIAPAVYTGPGNRDLDFRGKSIILRSTNPEDASIVAATIIDCGGAGRGFHFHSGETSAAVLDGLTIRNGSGYGGGVFCQDGSSPTIRNCVITRCSASTAGGIACVGGSCPVFMHCTISDNEALQGDSRAGGVYCEGNSNATFVRCTISRNRSLGRGGGAYFQFSSPLLDGCVITENSAAYGAGVACWGASMVINGCTIAQNEFTEHGGGIWLDGQANAQVTNCVIRLNIWTGTGYSSGRGGGIYSNAGGMTILRCSIAANTARDGGGLNLYDSAVVLSGTSVVDNSAKSFGGGVYLSGGDVKITNCSIGGNNSTSGGGGIYCGALSNGSVIANCRITGNSAMGGYGGGGICSRHCKLLVTGCTIWKNTATHGGGVCSTYLDDVTISNSVFWGNMADLGSQIGLARIAADEPSKVTIQYSDVQDGQEGILVDPECTLVWGTGNTSEDPRFVDPLGLDGEAGTDDDDLRLAPRSPCIDAGDNTAVVADVADLDGDGDTNERIPLDLNGDPRFVDDPDTADTGIADPPAYPTVVDMGAYEYDPTGDYDQDGVANGTDNCPVVTNPAQADQDGDGFGDACDHCMTVPSSDNNDSDHDGLGDACDNCRSSANPDQADADGDTWGDACDTCPTVPYPDNSDSDGDGFGDACDNCPHVANPDQADTNADGRGDACDKDYDADGVLDAEDNCPQTANPGQEDADQDGLGDVCDACPNDPANDEDGDGICEDADNCPTAANADQADADGDGLGDACDLCPQSLPGTPVDSSGCFPGDFDHDQDIDLDDFGHLQACLAGSEPIPAGCEDADLNGDTRVDQADAGIFIGCLSGAGVPADPDCVPSM